MAGAGHHDWVPGEVPTADNFNELLQQQVVGVYDDAADRDTQLSVVKAEGMVAYLRDVNLFTQYDGSVWVPLAPFFKFASAAARNSALAGVLTEGLFALLADTNTLTVYTGAVWSSIGTLYGTPTSWTPTWTGLTIGSASVLTSFWRVGRLVCCKLDVTWAANTSISGDVSFTLPVDCDTSTAGLYFGGCSLVDASTSSIHSGAIISKDLDEAFIRHDQVAGGIVKAALSSTAPFTWTTSDRFRAMFTYEAGGDG